MTKRQPDETAPVAGLDSIESLFVAKESVLLLYAQRLTRNEVNAQDIVQEAVMKLHAEFSTVRQPEAWLYRTVHNLALNHLRAERKIVPLEEEGQENAAREMADAQPLPDEQIERMEAIGQARLCLQTLGERQRELVKLKFEEDLSYREISERARLSVSNVGYMLHHALKDMASSLKKAGVIS